MDRNKQKVKFLYGRWTEFLCSAEPADLVALMGCKLEKVGLAASLSDVTPHQMSPDASNLPKHPPLEMGAVPGSTVLWQVEARCTDHHARHRGQSCRICTVRYPGTLKN